ncbi:class F sortase [Streptomyces sp. URMC 128]|uniref:class F sortase n=1 Tax=Streptomyces sp. URMC 128 TaxID=3423404 RepID=UPI003F1ABDB5
MRHDRLQQRDGLGQPGRARQAGRRPAGWYRYGPAPGSELGSAVIVGHVDSDTGEIGEFAALYDVRRGDRVEVRRAGAQPVRYRVVSRVTVPKDELPFLGVPPIRCSRPDTHHLRAAVRPRAGRLSVQPRRHGGARRVAGAGQRKGVVVHVEPAHLAELALRNGPPTDDDAEALRHVERCDRCRDELRMMTRVVTAARSAELEDR